MRRRVLSLCMALCMTLTLLPTATRANELVEVISDTIEAMPNTVEIADVTAMKQDDELLVELLGNTNEPPNYSTGVQSYEELKSRLEALQSKYVGKYWTTDGKACDSTARSKYYYGWQCKGFANYIFNDLFCKGNIGSYDGTKYYIPSPNGAQEIGKKWDINSNDAKALLSQAQIGDYIQVRRRGKDYGHTMIIAGANDSGITIFDCNSDGKCGVRLYAQDWATFASKNIGMSLYRSTAYPKPSVNHSPVIYFDGVDSPSPGQVHVAGWAFDPDDMSAQLDIHVYAWDNFNNATGLAVIQANVGRADVDATHHCGAYHGFDATFHVDITGEYRISCAAINVGEGADAWAEDIRTVTIAAPPSVVNHSPQAAFDLAESAAPGKLRVYGWAFDPDDTTAQLSIHVYLGNETDAGICYANIAADKHRQDVDNVFHCGAYHGFEDTIDIPQNGTYTVRVAALDTTEGGAKATWLAYKNQVTISNSSPTLNFEVAESTSPGKLHVRGWAFDPDDTAAQLSIHVYLGTESDPGSACAAIAADKHRPDVDNVHHCGAYHGFEDTIDITQSGTYTVRVAALDTTEGGAKASWSEYATQATIQKDMEAPKVTNASLSNISDNKCTFTITATDNVKVDHVDFHVWCDTWTQSGETVYQAKQSGNNWSYDIPLNLSNGKKWLMDARIYDPSGNQTLSSSGGTVPGALLRFYTITFNANGGSCSTANKQVIGARYWLRGQVGDTYVCTYGDLPTPTRDGYAFDGWYTEFNGGNKITKDSKVTIAENQTLYAHWKDTQSPVITQISGPYDLSPNGYTFKITATDTAGVAKVRALSWVDPVENAVKTWTDAAKSGNEWTVSVQRNGENNGNSSAWRTDLYAYDAAENASLCKQILIYYCTVTFDANGGDCATANKAVFRGGYLTNYTDSVDFHLKYGDLPTPTRSGYTFDGWYTSLEDGEQVTAESEVAVRTNHTLYAHWSVNVEITKVVPHNLSPNGYTLNVTTSDAVSSVRALSWVDPAETAEKIWDDATQSGSEWIVSVKRNGENNDGLPWRTNLYAYDGAGNSSLPENILIYYYTVAFNANGGVCDTNRKEIFSGSHLTDWANSRDFDLKYGDLPVPTRDGYAFDGWYTDADAGERVTEESKVTANENHTLYAHWTKKPAPPDSSTLQIIAGSVSAPKGSVVDIPVTIENNPGISGATLAVSYDKSALTLTSITKGTVFENGSYTAYPENGVVQWYHTENVTGDGVLFTFQFTVDGNAQNGNYNIAVGLRDGIPANLSNADSNIVNAQFISGVLEITSGIRGDATGDGVVAINDVVKVARAVGGSLTLTESEKTLADVTGDGVIAINDVVKLARYVAGSIATLQSAEAASLSGGESAVIEVATVSGKPGESVRVPVSITSNPGIAGLQLDVRFDNGLTLKNVVQGDILSGENFTPDVSAGRIQWYYEQANVTNTGVLFTLEFEIGAEAQNGDAYAVTVNVKDGIAANLSDYDFNPVNAEFKSGKIQIDETSDNIVINTVSRNGNTITANVVCVDSNATVFCAVYNNSGKMIAVRSVQITGESSYQFQFDGQQFDYAKAFIVDGNFCPLCESKKS